MKAYADSSFVVALYLPRESSPRAIAWIESHGKPLPFTPWHRLEVRNAIRLAAWQQLIDLSQCRIQLKQLDADLKEESLIVHASIDWTDVLREAEKLGATHNVAIGGRSADLFHVAAARALGRDTFLTFDARQAAMVKAAGLTAGP